MNSDTKISLLIGLGMVLVIGIVISDQLAVPNPDDNAPLLDYGLPQPETAAEPAVQRTTRIAVAQPQANPIPTPQEANASVREELLRPVPSRDVPVMRIGSTPPREAVITEPEPAPRVEPPRETPPRLLRLEEKPQQVVERVHTVKSGESLSAIAQRYYGDRNLWRRIAAANPADVGPDGRIVPGARLTIPAAERPVAESRTEPSRPASRPATVRVEEGDSLARLAKRHLGSTDRWDDLYEANRDQLSSPDRIRPGMVLRLPADDRAGAKPSSAGSEDRGYTVKSGDSLSSIAQAKLGSSSRWDEIYALNQDRIKDPDRLILGTAIRLPER
ncbi:LysM peptidoglycan-binding domain-containing protein [Mucisphaera calidilacus]|uniref:LysM domain/BON superfamily protein n=1 Tax=Mucisphaera calidilacus TaxID=2527982 RepID=A0A518BVI4_9BACT|nr:LysM peptidoglycan-binding domain-containing protein [Mucisphaera calidilacus]QDU70995.1 LysM domain/BON superfamily protein [Mucisphaera calidilacus]